MFERFTLEARGVVVGAADLARDLRHDYLGTEHLLLSLASGTHEARRALDRAGFAASAARDDLLELLGRCVDDDQDEVALGPEDAAALATIGVDLDDVRERAEAAFGPGALERPVRWLGSRRRRRCAMPFLPNAKKALELALREAIRLGDQWIGPEHVLLGLTRPVDTVAAKLLGNQEVRIDLLRADVTAHRRRSRGGDSAASA